MSICFVFLAATSAPSRVIAQDAVLRSSDGNQVFTYHYTTPNRVNAPLIVLFHMAGGDARGEYENIIPLLLHEGYDVLAVDTRSGGDRFGSENKTSIAYDGPIDDYCGTYPDVKVAMDHAREVRRSNTLFAWGSSFSGSLVVQYAVEAGGDLSGVLAFSPASGEPVAGCTLENYLADLTTPALFFRPQREMEFDNVIAQAQAIEATGLPLVLVEDGAHGSLMLDSARTGRAMNEVWDRLFAFLEANSSQ